MTEEIYVEKNVPLFEAIYGKGLISLGGTQAINSMFSGMALKNKKLLDIGSGIGGMAYHLAAEFDCEVTGLEIHPWMADYATRLAPAPIKNKLKFISYHPGGVIPLSEQSMDIACSKGVLTNLDVNQKKSLFLELHRILNNQGQLVLIDWLVPESIGPKNERLPLGDLSFKETQSSYTQLLQQCGFQRVQFMDKTKEYLSYVIQLDEMYHSKVHKQQYAQLISAPLRNDLINANLHLKKTIEAGEQLSMLVVANK